MSTISPNNSFEEKSVIVNINTFDDFTEGELDPLISTEKTSNELVFHYEGGSSNTLIGWYFFSLDDYGNCTDFEFSVNLDLNYSGSTMFGKVKLILGGYYNSQNQFISSDIVPETNNEKTLIMIGVEDLIVDGLYMYGDMFVNDEPGGGMGWYFDSDRDINFIFEIIRTGDQLKYEYWIDYVGGGGCTGNRDLHKIINYFIFVIEIHGDVTSAVNAKFFNLRTELNCSHVPTNQTEKMPMNDLILISSSGLLMVLIIIKKFKGKKKK
ncbi:MAG: hypothetical protein ACTSPM_05150 [Candidatus Heimdallarchaeota archaeon]